MALLCSCRSYAIDEFGVEGVSETLGSFQNVPGISFAAAVFSGVGMSLAAGSLFNYLSIKYNMAQVAPFTLLVPVMGVFLGWFVLDEELHTYVLTGGVMVLLGLAINQGLIKFPFLQKT